MDYLEKGFRAVKSNRGAPGIDGAIIGEFEQHLGNELLRLLGVSCVRDRVVQATLKLILEPILEPKFSDNSYGFRPGRNQPQAVDLIPGTQYLILHRCQGVDYPEKRFR